MTEKQTSFEQFEESSDNQEADGARDNTRVVADGGVTDKEFGDHLAASPKGDPRNAHRGSIKDAVRARKKYVKEHGDEKIGLDCCICDDPLTKGKNRKLRNEHLPESADPECQDGGFVCSDCLADLREEKIGE